MFVLFMAAVERACCRSQAYVSNMHAHACFQIGCCKARQRYGARRRHGVMPGPKTGYRYIDMKGVYQFIAEAVFALRCTPSPLRARDTRL